MGDATIFKSLKQIFGKSANGNGAHAAPNGNGNGNGIPLHVIHAHKRRLDYPAAIGEIDAILKNLEGNENTTAIRRVHEIRKELSEKHITAAKLDGEERERELDLIELRLSSVENIERIALKAFEKEEIVVEA